MAEIPAGRIGHSTEVFVYNGAADFAKTLAVFADEARTASGNNQPLFQPPGKGEDNGYGWRGYSNQPANFTKIGRIRDISGPEPSVNEVEVTSNDSPLSYKEFIPGLKDGGTVSFDMVYDVRDASQTGSGDDSLETMFEDQETRRFAIRVPVFRFQDRITDIAGSSIVIDNPADPYGGANGYPDRANSLNKFSNQAFHLFSGFVMRLGNEIPMEEAIMRSVEIKVTGRVESPNLARVLNLPVRAARYTAVKATNNFVAADFTTGPFDTNLLRIPAMTANSFIAFALPNSEGDPSDIRLGGLPTSRIGRFNKVGSTIAIGGVTYAVWDSNQAQDQSLTGQFLQIIP